MELNWVVGDLKIIIVPIFLILQLQLWAEFPLPF